MLPTRRHVARAQHGGKQVLVRLVLEADKAEHRAVRVDDAAAATIIANAAGHRGRQSEPAIDGRQQDSPAVRTLIRVIERHVQRFGEQVWKQDGLSNRVGHEKPLCGCRNGSW